MCSEFAIDEGNIRKRCRLMGGEQICTMKRDMGARPSSRIIGRAGLMLTCVRKCDSLFMSVRKFYHMFPDLPSNKLSGL
jgi:hypothetical protein